jgi:signal transduction histidine kinase
LVLANAGVRLSAAGDRLVVPTLNSAVVVWDLNPLRSELAPLGLDWGRAPAATAPKPRPAGWPHSTGAIMFGLACVTPAAFFALGSLRRHRRLLQQFVLSQAEAQRRSHELEAAKIELMHSQKMKALGTLAAGIAHDFNNLLSVIRMSNKLIGRAAPANPDVAEEVVSIEKAVQRGKHVVGSMLGYSRESPGGQGRCDPTETVEDTVSLLSREFLSGLELTLSLDRNAPPVRVGRSRLEQILLNLLVNAAEAMKGRGKLELAVQCRQQPEGDFLLRPQAAPALVELRVADSGPGIAPEILPRIFEPFFTTKSAGAKQGAGLGLSMVYTIAEQEGLGIAVESQPGRGAVFRILLPAEAPPTLAAKARAAG